jgi:ribosome-associated toxin RatA of RatAB toxin-antitoxin module
MVTPVPKIDASRTVEIDAPLARVYEIAADVPGAERWRNQVVEIEVLETDDEGRATLVEEVTDAKVKKVRTHLRFSYDPPNGMDWEQEKGEMKSLTGGWRFEALDEGRTRATFTLNGDPGRMLGMLLRGPAMGIVEDLMTKDPTDGLKREAESA